MPQQANDALNLGKAFVDALSRRNPNDLLALLHDQFVMAAVYPLVPGIDQAGAATCSGDASRKCLKSGLKGVPFFRLRRIPGSGWQRAARLSVEVIKAGGGNSALD